MIGFKRGQVGDGLHARGATAQLAESLGASQEQLRHHGDLGLAHAEHS